MKVKCISNHNFNHNLFRGLEIGLIYDIVHKNDKLVYMIFDGRYYPKHLFVDLREENLNYLLGLKSI